MGRLTDVAAGLFLYALMAGKNREEALAIALSDPPSRLEASLLALFAQAHGVNGKNLDEIRVCHEVPNRKPTSTGNLPDIARGTESLLPGNLGSGPMQEENEA